MIDSDLNDSTDRANAMVIQADGKLVAAGWTQLGSAVDFGLTTSTA